MKIVEKVKKKKRNIFLNIGVCPSNILFMPPTSWIYPCFYKGEILYLFLDCNDVHLSRHEQFINIL